LEAQRIFEDGLGDSEALPNEVGKIFNKRVKRKREFDLWHPMIWTKLYF
jgi:hypothetical protein